MYAGKIQAVEIPTIGKVHILKNGYVYWYNEAKWDNTKKMTVDNRIIIGKLDPEHAGMMFPNKTYFSIFQIHSSFKEHPTILHISGLFSKTLNFGPYLALSIAMEQIGALSVLKRFFPADWSQIIAVAIHSIDAENSVAQDYPFWAFHNYSGLSKSLSSGEISRLYERIVENEESISNFMCFFKDEYHNTFATLSETVVAFDSTNQNTSSKHIIKAEYGHPKSNEGLPVINTALFVDEVTGIPLYYEHFYGSLLDKSETPYTIEKAKELGFKKLFLMMDRGYCSQAVLDSMDDLSFGIMCPDNLNIVKNMIGKYGYLIKNHEKYYIPKEDVYGICENNIKVFDGTYDAYLFYDSRRAEDERCAMHQKIKHLTHLANLKMRYSEKLKKRFEPWLIIAETKKEDSGRNFSVMENSEHVQESLDEAGFFVIISNAGLDSEKMIEVARMRDRGEKTFRRIKTHFGLAKTYMHKAETYEGKMFVSFIALIIIEAYRYYIKDILLSTTSETTATSIGELRKYQIYQKQDGTWAPAYAMSKKQKQIFHNLQFNEEMVEKIVRGLELRV